jgi:hypothetical protein
MLKEKIYYCDKWLLDQLNDKFELVDSYSWYSLYRDKESGYLWRLDVWDKYQEQYFVRIENIKNWKEFDASDLQIELLRRSRGSTDKICKWSGCSNAALIDLVFCEQHAYREMAVRR